MCEFTSEHPAETPANEQYSPAVVYFIKTRTEQLHRVRFRATVQSEAPRVNTPSRPGESAPHIHRRPVGCQETRKDERWRPVLGTPRAHRAKSRKKTRKVPGQLTPAAPGRRGNVV